MPPSNSLILVADDDPGLLHLISRTLELEGYQVLTAVDGPSALKTALEAEGLELLLLDILMPGIDGFEVCRRIRQVSEMPIVMLTARVRDEDKVRGLEGGADDYITKPFDTGELLARVKAVLRRSQKPRKAPPLPFTSGELVIDFYRHEVSLAGRGMELTSTEYKLLFLLASNAGRVLAQEYLLEQVWGREYKGSGHLLQVAIARLRQKLKDDTARPRYIATRAGIGYIFLPPVPEVTYPGLRPFCD